MKPKMSNEILLSYYKSKNGYEKLSNEILRFFEMDPDFPKISVYAIKHRIKDEERLIEKINKENESVGNALHITSKNYQDIINDILGMRIVCLRRSDVEIVEKYINSLNEEKKLIFIQNPEKKQPPFLWVPNPEELTEEKDIQYSGYSSIHYVIKPGENISIPKELLSLRCEIQVRTILEDAWGEIDHKYRYEIKRKGIDIPSFIDRGFRSFSAYLQAAAVQTEYLCREVEKVLNEQPPLKPLKQPKSIKPILPTIEETLNKKVGFIPEKRTLFYIEKKLGQAGYMQNIAKALNDIIITRGTIESFKKIYKNVMKKEPFLDSSNRDIDLLNLLNFSIYALTYPQDIVQARLRAVLENRIRK